MRINTLLFDLPRETQEQIQADFDSELKLSSRHCSLVHFMNNHHARPDSYRSIDDPMYCDPTTAEITEVIDHLASAYSIGSVTKQLGLQNKSNPTDSLNRWKTGESRIPYPAWRLLLILDGRVVEVNRIPESDGSQPWKYNYNR